MKLRNMSIMELSIASNIHKASLSNFVHGKYIPKTDKIYTLAKALQVNPAWLIGYDVPIDEVVIAPKTNTVLDKINNKLAHLDDTQLNAVLNVLEAMYPEKRG